MREIRIALLGAGTVGGGVLRLLREHGDLVRSRLGGDIVVRRVLARDPTKHRPGVPADVRITFDPEEALGDPEVDVVVEVLGGEEPAGTFVRRALSAGKPVVTANKALLAAHGQELFEIAEAKRADLYFEAAVGGSIPVVRVLRESLVGERITGVVGILNGTTNWVLTRMTEDGMAFADAVRHAQERGFAEADPSLDVDGHDAAHKLAILAMLAFRARVDLSKIHVEGIRAVSSLDLAFAKRLGYVLKSLAVGRDHGQEIELRVHPTLVPADHVVAGVRDQYNAVYVEGPAHESLMLSGHGAGALPTAVSVVSDVVDVARNILRGSAGRVPSRAAPGASLEDRAIRSVDDVVSRYFLRVTCQGQPRTLARITDALASHEVSVDQMFQAPRPEGGVHVVMTTLGVAERSVRGAVAEIDALRVVSEPTRVMRIELWE